MSKSYHDILGVSPNATKQEIRSAYLKKVKELHPDKVSNKGKEEECNKKMSKVQEAYDYLYLGKGPEQQEYGGSHQNYGDQGGFGQKGFGSDIFEQFFNTVFNFKSIYSAEIKLKDFLTKDSITVELQEQTVCPHCKGMGCRNCYYRGKTSVKQKVTIEYKDKQNIFALLNNEVKYTLNSGSSILLQLNDDEYFIDTKNRSITLGFLITHQESLVGADIKFELFNRTVSITIPPKTNSHSVILSTGSNIYWNSYSKANIYAKIIIIHSSTISPEKRVVEFKKA